MKRIWLLAGIAATATAVVVGAGVGSAAPKAPQAKAAQQLTKVTLQLKWVTQAQFAGYYAAKEKGYY